MVVKQVKGNLAKIDAEAIVVPSNRFLKEGGGAAKGIFEAAGRKKLSEACSKLGPCETGNVKATTAFDMDVKYLLHTCVPNFQKDENPLVLLMQSYMNCLYMAEQLGCRSIAFPLLGTGHNHFDLKPAYLAALESFQTFLKSEPKNLQGVFLVLYDHPTLDMVRDLSIAPIVDMPVRSVSYIHKQKQGIDLEQILRSAVDWFNVPENRQLVMNAAVFAANMFKKTPSGKPHK